MFNWYSKVDRDMLDVLVPASFMMEVGKIVIAHELIESKKDSEFKERLSNISSLEELSSLEKELTGFSNEEITAKIFEQWNLEAELVETIAYSNIPQDTPEHILPYAKAVFVVKNAINIFEQLSDNSISKAKSVAESFELDTQLLDNALEKVKQ